MTPEEIMKLNIPLKELITYADDLKRLLMKMNEQISENVRILKGLGRKAGKSNDPMP